MREIKFRAWCPEISEMLCPVSNKAEWTIDDQTGFIAPLIELEKGIWGMVDKYELMQYTGIKDKNGVEIYEGDVVRVTDDGRTDFSDGGVGAVGNMENLFMWYIDGQVQNALFDINQSYEIEVIGNIYANPELLEVVK